MPEGLIQSELLGHEKGACTGALQRGIERFERADQGTLLHGEIGNLPVEIRIAVLLLRYVGKLDSK